MNDDKLQKVLAFESEYENLFRYFLDLILGASINQLTAFRVPINDSSIENSFHIAPNQKSPIVLNTIVIYNVFCPIRENIFVINIQLKESYSLVDPIDECLERSLQHKSSDKQSGKNGINVYLTFYKKDRSLDKDSTPSNNNSSTDSSDENKDDELNDGNIINFIFKQENDTFCLFL